MILEKLKKINSKFEKINLENLFSKDLFLSKPNILYSFLRELKLNEKEYIKPNIIHYFIRYLIENTYGSYIFSENFEGIELNSGIPSENIVFGKGNLLEGHCAKCDKNIEVDIINKGILEETVIKCDKCDGPCKPKIFLRGDEINQYFYEQTKYILSSNLIFVIGTDLSTMPFKDISKILNTTNPWIVEINQKEVGDFKFNELSNNELFLEGNCEDIIIKIINDCGWNEEDIKNYSPNKSKYCNLEDFENYVLKEHKDKENYYILSPNYYHCKLINKSYLISRARKNFPGEL
jgi:NAD-dependent SIR2 family protein deacetylase